MSGAWGTTGCLTWLVIGLFLGALTVAGLYAHFDRINHERAIADPPVRAGHSCPWCERAYPAAAVSPVLAETQQQDVNA